jgi:hypothetical protein
MKICFPKQLIGVALADPGSKFIHPGSRVKKAPGSIRFEPSGTFILDPNFFHPKAKHCNPRKLSAMSVLNY